MNNSTTTFEIAFYRMFIGTLAWTVVLGAFLGSLVIFLFKAGDVQVPSLILGITLSLFAGTIYCFIASLLVVRLRKITVSPEGIKLSRSKYVEWGAILEVKRLNYPGFKILVIINKNKGRFYIPLYLNQIEKFQKNIIQFAGMDSPLTLILENMQLSEPPELRVESSQRSSFKKRLVIAILMGVTFVLVAGSVWGLGWVRLWNIYDSLNILHDMPATVSQYCFNISRWLIIWFIYLSPILLSISALIPPLMIFMSFKKKIIIMVVILCIIITIAFYVVGFAALSMAC